MSALLALAVAGTAQTPPSSGLNYETPPAMNYGAPAGSYALSQLEHVNLFNGNLNVFVPIREIESRGNTGYAIGVKIERRWYVQNSFGNLQAASDELPEGLSPYYSPGVFFSRQTGVTPSGASPLVCGPIEVYPKNVLRLTFKDEDGTETEFRDVQTQGQPLAADCNASNMPSRGRVFQSIDGSFASFVSDGPVYDFRLPLGPCGCNYVLGYDGWLYWADGRRYRIVSGHVKEIHDLNGNITTINYSFFTLPDGVVEQRPTSVTDALNRQTSITYSDTNGTNPPRDEITFKGTGGALRVVKVFRRTLAQNGNAVQSYTALFPELPNSSSQSFNPTVVSQITIPDGLRSYTFTYNNYGELKRMIVPTGGAFEYDFGGGPTTSPDGVLSQGGNSPQIYRRLVQRRVFADAAGSQLNGRIDYSANDVGADTAVGETISDSANNILKQITHTFFGRLTNPALYSPDPNTNAGYTAWRDGLEYQVALSGPNRLVNTQFNQTQPAWWPNGSDSAPINSPQANSVTTTLQDTGQVSQERYSYDQFNNRTDIYQTDYGQGSPGKLLRHLSHAFVATNQVANQSYDYTCAGPPYCPPGQTLILHARRLPFRDIVWQLDQNGNDAAALSQTDYFYDQQAPGDCPAITGHDSALGTSAQARGDVNGIRQYLLPANHPITRLYTYDIAGNVTVANEPSFAPRFFVYTDKFGNPDGNLSDAVSIPELPGGAQTCAYTSQTTDLLGYSRFAQRDYYTGKIVDQSDPNGVISTTYYNDSLERPTQVIRANNQSASRSQSAFAYDDANHKITSTEDQASFGDNVIKTAVVYDGIGRTISNLEYEDASNSITRSTTYDVLSRVRQQSNPYRSGDTPAYTLTAYDALDRPTTIIKPDSAIYFISWLGNQASSQDPANKITRAVYDPIGRLTQVIEDPFGSNFSTNYSYDENNNLVRVAQGVQGRRFTYDSLSRLVSEYHPETGTTTYSYDDNNNLLSKLDSRNITTTFTYDAGNRPKSKSYSDSTPAVTFTYDDASVPFSLERLTAVTTTVAKQQIKSFDPLGRVLSSSQQIDGLTFNLNYGYTLDGSLASETYPSGRVVKYAYDPAARAIRVDNGNQSGYYITGIKYAAHGAESQVALGNGLVENFIYNKRLQPTQHALGTAGNPASVWQLINSFQSSSNSTDNNGNVLGQTLTLPGITPSLSTAYSYDGLNRLTQAIEASGASTIWSQAFVYDRYGNKALQLPSYIPTGSYAITSLNSYDFTTNRLISDPYDNAGNLTSDQIRTFGYDAESRLTSSTAGGTTTSFSYDGSGQRVRKQTGSATTYYAYDALGRLIAEQANTSSSDLTGTNFITADHLRSTRVITDSTANVKARYDYLPFGDLIEQIGPRGGVSGYADVTAITEQFTGKERDPESSLDYFMARYYSSHQGRFTSVDPAIAAQPSNPQAWNKYAYSVNDPLRYVDTDGKWSWDVFTNTLAGELNAFFSDLALGAGRLNRNDSSFVFGQTIGDVASVLEGGAEIIGGVLGEAAGTTLDATGIGAAVGVPVNVLSAGLIAHGAGVTATGFEHLTNRPQSSGILESRRNDFSASTKQEIDARNAAQNNGNNKCEDCGKSLEKMGNEKGRPTPDNQLQRHHKIPLQKGGPSTPKNAKVLCPECHKAAHVKLRTGL